MSGHEILSRAIDAVPSQPVDEVIPLVFEHAQVGGPGAGQMTVPLPRAGGAAFDGLAFVQQCDLETGITGADEVRRERHAAETTAGDDHVEALLDGRARQPGLEAHDVRCTANHDVTSARAVNRLAVTEDDKGRR